MNTTVLSPFALRALTFAFILTVAVGGPVHAADISGMVKGEGMKPIEGATVKVYSAWMRTGSSPKCPTCWVDCQKSARTGPDGRYHIAGVSDELVFDLLVLADGHAPVFVEDVDPAKASPADAVLKSRDLAAIPPTQVTYGRVVGSDGHPIAGARVKSVGPPWVDRMALTDVDGRFVLVWSKPAQGMWLRISAEGWGSAQAESKTGRDGIPKPVEVKLSRGVTIMGRVLDEQGKPAPRVKMAAIQAQRSFEKDLPVVEAETGKDGSFYLFHVPAHDELAVYGEMEGLTGRGAVPVRTVITGADEETVQTQDFVIQRACKVSGQFVLAAGKKFPAKTRASIGRDVAWGSQVVEVSPDGRFEFDGFPPGEVMVVVPPRGLPERHPQAVSHSFEIDVSNMRVQRKVEADVKDLKIELVAKDTEAWQEECRRAGYRNLYAEFLGETPLSREQEAVFITALLRKLDSEFRWQQVTKGEDWDARIRADAAAFEKEVRPVFGEQIFQKLQDFDALGDGRGWVTGYLLVRKGESLSDAEKKALVGSISRHMKQYLKSHPVDNAKVLTKDERRQWHHGEYDTLLAAGAEALPPAKLTFFREWVEKERAARWEQIDAAYRKE